MRSTRIPLLLPACPHTELAFVPFFAYLWVSHNPEHHDRSTRDPPLPPQPPQDPAPAGRLLPVCRSRCMDDPPRLRSPVAGRPIHHSRRRMAVDTLLRDRSRRPDRCGPPPQTLPAGRGIARRAQAPFHPETRKGYFFPWESIEAFSRVRIAGNDLLAVHTRDLAQRYDRSGPIGQIAIDISLSCSDTPYTINDRVLDAAPGEVERSLEEHLAAYRARSEREPAS